MVKNESGISFNALTALCSEYKVFLIFGEIINILNSTFRLKFIGLLVSQLTIVEFNLKNQKQLLFKYKIEVLTKLGHK